MALFLEQATLYRIIQRELPEDVYPDAGDPSLYWSTSDSAAEAEILAQLYVRYETMWDNYWPQTADADAIPHHEMAHFGAISTALALQARRDRVLAKMRALPSLSVTDVLAAALVELPDGTIAQIIEWGCSGGGGTWHIGVSELGVGTILGGYGSHFYPAGTDLCMEDGSEFGMTEEEWEQAQQNAYTYELRIYEYTMTDAEAVAVDRALTKAEPSEAFHFITDGLDMSEFYDP